MELKFIFFTLLIAGSNGIINDGRMERLSRCVQMKCANLATPDPCNECRNKPINITDTRAEKCLPDGVVNGICNCVCKVVQCEDGEIIETSTCTSNSRVEDCRCIPIDPCAKCRNQPVIMNDTYAEQDFPSGGEPCVCLHDYVPCDIGYYIDTSTCTPNGHIDDCRCNDPFIG